MHSKQELNEKQRLTDEARDLWNKREFFSSLFAFPNFSFLLLMYVKKKKKHLYLTRRYFTLYF